MGALASYFRPPEPPRKATAGDLAANIVKVHFKGILGFLFNIIFFTARWQRGNLVKIVETTWIIMISNYLLRPVKPGVTSLIPMFVLPMSGCINTGSICSCYFNEATILFFTGTVMMMLFNCSNLHKRMDVSLMSADTNASFKPTTLFVKASLAAYFTSLVSYRIIATDTIVDILQPGFDKAMQLSVGQQATDFAKLKHNIYNGVASSSVIGSFVIIHGFYNLLFVRGMMDDYANRAGSIGRRKREAQDEQYYTQQEDLTATYTIRDTQETQEDLTTSYTTTDKQEDLMTTSSDELYTQKDVITTSNFSSERKGRQDEPATDADATLPPPTLPPITIGSKPTAESFPYMPWLLYGLVLSLTMFAANLGVGYLLVSSSYKPTSPYTLEALKSEINKAKKSVPEKMTGHEIETILAFIIVMLALITRYNDFRLGYAWKVAYTQEASVLCGALIILSCLPKTLGFLKTFNHKKKSEMEQLRAESAWIYWIYAKNNTPYEYTLLLGSGFAMAIAARLTMWSFVVANKYLDWMADLGYALSTFVSVFIIAILSNIMPPVGVVTTIVPLFFFASVERVVLSLKNIELIVFHKHFTVALGIASAFSFIFPNPDTPTYHMYKVGKLKAADMAKPAIASIIVCCIILSIFTIFIAPRFYRALGYYADPSFFYPGPIG